jgi:hydrogenase maturation protease
MTPRLLIACIGNIFLGDDAFGVEVARRLAGRPRPEGVRLVDFGIRGYDLALALLDDATDIAILVDAAPRGEPPGTLYVIEPEWEERNGSDANDASPIEAHSLDPVKVLRLVLALGGRPKRVFLVGCEPTPFDEDDDPSMELSAPVLAAVDEAVVLVESLVAQVIEGPGAGVSR